MAGGYKKLRPEDNPKPFLKGHPPLPGVGRRKKIPELPVLLAEVLGTEDEEERVSLMQEIIQSLALKAKKGDTRAAEVLLERVYGKVKQDLNITGAINIHFDKEDANL